MQRNHTITPPEGNQSLCARLHSHVQLKNDVKTGKVQPTVRAVKTLLAGWGISSSDSKRQAIATESLDKLFNDGVLILNPENEKSGIKKSKYILA